MTVFYLSYQQKPLGCFNSIEYIFDFILEIFHFPTNDIKITQFKIIKFEINRGYPINKFKFVIDKKLHITDENNKRLELNKEQLNKFLKIVQKFNNINSDDITEKKLLEPVNKAIKITPKIKNNIITHKKQFDNEITFYNNTQDIDNLDQELKQYIPHYKNKDFLSYIKLKDKSYNDIDDNIIKDIIETFDTQNKNNIYNKEIPKFRENFIKELNLFKNDSLPSFLKDNIEFYRNNDFTSYIQKYIQSYSDDKNIIDNIIIDVIQKETKFNLLIDERKKENEKSITNTKNKLLIKNFKLYKSDRKMNDKLNKLMEKVDNFEIPEMFLSKFEFFKQSTNTFIEYYKEFINDIDNFINEDDIKEFLNNKNDLDTDSE